MEKGKNAIVFLEELRWEAPSSIHFLISAMHSMDMAEDDIDAMAVSMADSYDLGETPTTGA